MTATRWITRALSALLALALLVGSLIAIVEMVVAATGHEPWLLPYPQWVTWMSERAWTDPVVRAILVGLLIVGLLLIFLAVRRGKPATLPLRQRTDGVAVTASRRSVERSLAAAASRISGITGAGASLRRRSARIQARAAALAGGRSESDLRQEVQSAVTARLDSLGLARDLRLRVQVDAKDRR